MQKRRLPKVLSIGCLTVAGGLAAVLGMSGILHGASAQESVPAYDPYPPGILCQAPPDGEADGVQSLASQFTTPDPGKQILAYPQPE